MARDSGAIRDQAKYSSGFSSLTCLRKAKLWCGLDKHPFNQSYENSLDLRCSYVVINPV